MFQQEAAPQTARYLRVSYTLFRILIIDLWSTLGAIITGLIFLFFAELLLASIIILAVAGPLFLAETVFTIWFANRAAENLGYTLGDQELIVKSGVFIHRKAKIPFNRIQDVTTTQGPIERMYGIHTLLVQTAGHSGQVKPEGTLRGILDADEMADTIMAAVKRGH